MNRKHPSALTDLAFVTYQPDAVSGGSSVLGGMVPWPSNGVFQQIPAADLRNFVDGLFPGLATNQLADSVAGYGHRYVAGHDLLLDLPSTVTSHGFFEGTKQAGHILFTDFPTKAGIPIPGFSQSGLGPLVEQLDISRNWLQLNLFDCVFGVPLLADSAFTIVSAMQGNLAMSFPTAVKTFGVGALEIAFGVSTQNPLFMAGGASNISAGAISAWNTISTYVNPLVFLSAAGGSALVGFGISHVLIGKNKIDAAKDAVRSGTVGALFSVALPMGVGAITGITAYQLAASLAEKHRFNAQAFLGADQNSYRMLLESFNKCEIKIDCLRKNIKNKQIEVVPPKVVCDQKTLKISPAIPRISAPAPVKIPTTGNTIKMSVKNCHSITKKRKPLIKQSVRLVKVNSSSGIIKNRH